MAVEAKVLEAVQVVRRKKMQPRTGNGADFDLVGDDRQARR